MAKTVNTLLHSKKQANSNAHPEACTNPETPETHDEEQTRTCRMNLKFLPNIISNAQTGFLKNRFIGENIRLIESIINHKNMEQILGLLLFVDFEKAFDSIEWSFIEKTLRHFNFGTSLVSLVNFFIRT